MAGQKNFMRRPAGSRAAQAGFAGRKSENRPNRDAFFRKIRL